MKQLKQHIIILISCSALIIFSCKKEGVDNVAQPILTVIDVSATEISQFSETITITLGYEDGDGDLGDPHPDTLSLLIQDSRLKNPDRYYIPPLAPLSHQLSITGKLEVTLIAPFLLGNGGNEQVTYTIKARDRAGHWSQEVMTPTITIKP